MKNLPLYQSHKRVRAAKIVAIGAFENGSKIKITLAGDFTPRVYDRDALKGKPEISEGFYLVEYEDGYFSFSPAQAFEDGYELLEEETAPLSHGDVVKFSKASGNEPGIPRAIVGVRRANGEQFFILHGMPGSLFLAYSLVRVDEPAANPAEQ